MNSLQLNAPDAYVMFLEKEILETVTERFK